MDNSPDDAGKDDEPTAVDLMEWYDERVGIMQFDGKRSRQTAERAAAISLRREFGWLPPAVVAILDSHDDATF